MHAYIHRIYIGTCMYTHTSTYVGAYFQTCMKVKEYKSIFIQNDVCYRNTIINYTSKNIYWLVLWKRFSKAF